MKKIVVLMCITCMALSLFSCRSSCIKLHKADSFFSDFKVEDEKVYIYCTLFIENQSNSEKNVAIKASLDNDAKNGLLKEAVIDGYSVDGSTKIFKLQNGESQIDVVFIGDYAGTEEKINRLLPDIEIIEME
ncbi:MAG: hypothetical protein J6B54_04760 [Clostridia bacterium]|nr:hypothetical protein [Clostridia bacterium]